MTNPGDHKKVIALFDFDGTITTKDSLGAFLLYNFGILKCSLYLIVYAPIHFLYKLGLTSSTAAKNFLLPFFLKNVSLTELDKMCETFCQNKLPEIINPDAIQKIQWHLQNDHEVVIVSASPYNWIEPWAKRIGIKKFITSKLEINGDHLTGRLAGKNCNHQEKALRIKKAFPNIDSYEVYAYGNSSGDRFMLSLASKQFYKKFK